MVRQEARSPRPPFSHLLNGATSSTHCPPGHRQSSQEDSMGRKPGWICPRLWGPQPFREVGSCPCSKASPPALSLSAEPANTHPAKSISKNNSPHMPSPGSLKTHTTAKAFPHYHRSPPGGSRAPSGGWSCF